MNIRLLKQIVFVFIFTIGTQFSANAQNVGINETGANPDPSAMLDIATSNKGILIPRLSKAQKSLIATPANGLLVYQTDDTVGLWYYENTKWVPVMRSITFGKGLTGGYIQGKGTVALKPTGVTARKYGAMDSIPVVTVNSEGQIIAATTIATNFLNKTDTLWSWRIMGNKGTDDTKHFLGTQDNKALRFRVNNKWAGEISPKNDNISFGTDANNTSNGAQNIAIGLSALEKAANNKGDIIAIGQYALSSNGIGATGSTQGIENIAIGPKVMSGNRSGSYNVGLGQRVMETGQFNYGNIGIGFEAMKQSYNSYYNVAIGMYAMSYNQTGNYNTAIGYASMLYNGNGYYNCAYGFYSLVYNSTGAGNTASGMYSMGVNTSGSWNTASGYQALYTSYGSNYNTAMGAYALINTTTKGDNNTSVGYSTLYKNTTGYSNVAIG
ncbi:MAG: hypothetical protein EBQ97_04315, partial [Bacteroidetes bacterium]|nr:hypothetical protein [Bacteroidota bacterium]